MEPLKIDELYQIDSVSVSIAIDGKMRRKEWRIYPIADRRAKYNNIELAFWNLGPGIYKAICDVSIAIPEGAFLQIIPNIVCALNGIIVICPLYTFVNLENIEFIIHSKMPIKIKTDLEIGNIMVSEYVNS